MLKLVYGVFPAIVVYNDKLVPEKFGGYARLFFVTIKEKYKNDVGLLNHELTHVKQLYRTAFLHPLFYILSKRYRLASELEAYRAQLSYCVDKENSIKWMAQAISTKYNLDVSLEEIEHILTNIT